MDFVSTNGIHPTTKVVGFLPVRIVNADNVGYTWVKEGNTVERKSETVVNMQRFIKNIDETIKPGDLHTIVL
jgi:hypothetical protein